MYTVEREIFSACDITIWRQFFPTWNRPRPAISEEDRKISLHRVKEKNPLKGQ